MLFDAQQMLRNKSILDILVNNKNNELMALMQRVTSIVNYDKCKELIDESCEKSKADINRSYDSLIDMYTSSLDCCLHEIVFYINDEDKFVCACCDKNVQYSDQIVISITREEYENKEYISELRSDILTYLFFTSQMDKKDIEADFMMLKENPEQMKLTLGKRGEEK